jgi:hypothetical protein
LSFSHVTWWNSKSKCKPSHAPACCHLSRFTYSISEVTFVCCPPNAMQLHDLQLRAHWIVKV